MHADRWQSVRRVFFEPIKAIFGATYDDQSCPKEISHLVRQHLNKIFDNLEQLAKHSDLGVPE